MTGLLSSCRILVVEDEMLVLMNIEMALEDLGCTMIHSAATVAEALQILGEHNFSAAMLDVNLGAEKSFPVADQLALRGIPFAFSTGNADLGGYADFDDRPVLKKPYLRDELAAMFERLIPGIIVGPGGCKLPS